jgi:transposase
VARYAGLTGSPDESGLKSREKGLAKAGNARVRRGLIQFMTHALRSKGFTKLFNGSSTAMPATEKKHS